VSRRLISLAVLAALGLAVLAADASAGTYTVRACQSDGINRSWQAYHSDGYTDAYVECPGGVTVGGHENEGMVARNTGGPGAAPPISHARVFFDAPPGARVVQVTGQMKQSGTGGWQAGLYDDTAGRWAWCGPSCTSSFGQWLGVSVGLSSTRVSALVVCGSGSGCDRDGLHGYAALRDVSVVVAEDGLPSVSATGGGLAASGWHRGVGNLNVAANDAVGVEKIMVYIDGTKVATSIWPCDYARAIPCASGSRTVTIDTRAFSDGWHKVRVQALDAAGNTRSVDRALLLDNHPPARPSRLQVDGGTGWRSGRGFSLRWTEPRQAAAPITRAYVALCRIGTGGPCTPPRPLGHVKSARVEVPSPGQWRARVWLADAAGNASVANAAEAVLRVDDQPPTLVFEPPTEAQPTLITVAAADTGSGLAAREVFLRRRGSTAWNSLPVSVQAHGFTAVIDDESLPRGRYELRARVVDLAGNERSTDRRADGKLAELALPLRIVTTLRVGKPTRVRARGARGKYRIRLVEKPRTSYGRTIPLRGRLTSPGGNPLAGRDIHVFERTNLLAAPWRPIATVTTSRTGRFTFKALRGPSRTLRFRFGGSATIRGRSAEVRLGVRAATSLRVSRHSVVNGEDVAFRGRLRGGRIPASGKLIELQAYARGHWLTFGTSRAMARSGRWSFPYRFSATRGSVRYRFRVRIPKEAGYPYETGVSRQVAVKVRGL
jgi:hypothetical protein